MATAIVSGRVDSAVKERAGAYIHAAGLTVGDVIRTVWESIAATGEIPQPEGKEETADDPFERLLLIREKISKQPKRVDLTKLNDEDIRDMHTADLIRRYEEL